MLVLQPSASLKEGQRPQFPFHALISDRNDTACRDEDISMLLLTLHKYCSTCLTKCWIFSPLGKNPSCQVVCGSAEAGAESGGVPTRVHFLELFFILARERSLSCNNENRAGRSVWGFYRSGTAT